MINIPYKSQNTCAQEFDFTASTALVVVFSLSVGGAIGAGVASVLSEDRQSNVTHSDGVSISLSESANAKLQAQRVLENYKSGEDIEIETLFPAWKHVHENDVKKAIIDKAVNQPCKETVVSHNMLRHGGCFGA
jgi:hypothetical protein